MTALNRLGAGEAAARIAAGEISSEALVSDCLARIEARESAIGAWQYLDPEAALAEARARDRSAAMGPLHGVPVAVKDLIDTADMPTGYGSAIYDGHRPAADAVCVAAARRAGAVVLGKTVTTEFAAFTPGRTANPRNPRHTPGGSSSGSAAAVADWMVPLAFGSQTAGSVIRPAAFCGVVGFKPSHDVHDLGGVKTLAPSLDTLGVFGRSTVDVALFDAALRGRMPIDLAMAGPPRLGLCRTPQWPAADPACQQVVESAATQLAAAGAEIVEVVLPDAFDGLVDAQIAVMGYEMARSLAAERRMHWDRLSGKLQRVLLDGAACADERYATAQTLAENCRAMLDAALGQCEALLVPSAPGEAPAGLDFTGDPLFNRLWTLLHVPCITLPAAVGPHGLPIGIQLVARIGADDRLLRTAHWAEERL